MSQFTGKQHKGAMRDRRATKKREAEARNTGPRWACADGHLNHNEAGMLRCAP